MNNNNDDNNIIYFNESNILAMVDEIEMLHLRGHICQINSGGCGIAALTMLRFIENKNKDMRKLASIIYSYTSYDKNEFEHNNKIIHNRKSNKEEKLIVPYHILLRIEEVVFDITGRCRNNYGSFRDEFKANEFGIEILLETINNYRKGNGWNRCFKRKKEIPKLEKVFGVDLSDINR
jgi:hypothetical protein